MKSIGRFYLSSSGFARRSIKHLLPFVITLGVILTTAFQASLAFAQQSLPAPPKLSLPTYTLACPQPILPPPEGAPKNALIIFVEENTSQSFSVSWQGMSNVLQRMGTIALFPPEVRSVVDTFRRNLQNISPQTNIVPEIERQLRGHIAQMTKEMVRRARNMMGLPGAGCLSGLIDTLGRHDLRIGEDIYKVFMDTYGEAGLSNCLKEMALPYYDHVQVLTDQHASFQNFSDVLVRLHRCGFTVDVLIDGHGCGQNISMNNKSCGTPGLCFYNPSNPSAPDRRNAQQLEQIKAANGGQPLRLNAVYMVSCWGSEFNQAWINLGAKASNGPLQLDYYVLLSPILFLDGFTRGEKTLKAAADDAYNVEKTFLNGLPSYRVEVDLRNTLNQLFPIRYTETIPCIVGFSEKIDYRGMGDYCVGEIAGQKLVESPKNCPVGSTKVIRGGRDQCKQDLLGLLRDQAHWSFDLGVSYSAFIDKALAVNYGANPAQPVNNRVSSQRIQLGNVEVREATVCRLPPVDHSYCFGAIGQFCGGIPIPGAPQGEYWGCSGNTCIINAGSWEHDQCCFEAGRAGTMCGNIAGPKCNAAWNKAVHRTVHRLSWKRRVNTCWATEDNPLKYKDLPAGKVNHAEYCAPAGTIVVHIDDAPMCCSRVTRMFNPQDAGDQALARAQRVIFDPPGEKAYVPGVCTRPPIVPEERLRR